MAGEGFEIGLNSFGEVATERDGRALSDAETVRLLVAEARLAESAGIDVSSAGERWRYWQPVVERLADERGFYAPSRKRYQAEVDGGALFVGSPETVARKIATAARATASTSGTTSCTCLATPARAASSRSAARSAPECASSSRPSPPTSDIPAQTMQQPSSGYQENNR